MGEGGVNRSPSDTASATQLVDDDGCYMKVRRTPKAVTYAIPLDDGATREDRLSFADWIENRIPQLREEYRKGK